MQDPTYNKHDIDKNPIWQLAFSMSEIENHNAPIGWGKYINLASGILANYTIKRKNK